MLLSTQRSLGAKLARLHGGLRTPVEKSSDIAEAVRSGNGGNFTEEHLVTAE